MFFILTLERDVELKPQELGPNLRGTIQRALINSVEGTSSGKYGFVICITEVKSISKGRIREGAGCAVFHVEYHAVVFRPFRGEVLDCLVTSVSKVGFFAEAGPLQLFISNHLLPPDFEYTTDLESSFVNEDQSERIRAGTEVRVRIVGTKLEANSLFCVAAMNEDYLGKIDSDGRRGLLCLPWCCDTDLCRL